MLEGLAFFGLMSAWAVTVALIYWCVYVVYDICEDFSFFGSGFLGAKLFCCWMIFCAIMIVFWSTVITINYFSLDVRVVDLTLNPLSVEVEKKEENEK